MGLRRSLGGLWGGLWEVSGVRPGFGIKELRVLGADRGAKPRDAVLGAFSLLGEPRGYSLPAMRRLAIQPKAKPMKAAPTVALPNSDASPSK